MKLFEASSIRSVLRGGSQVLPFPRELYLSPVQRRFASLSAIHNGIRRSEKAKPQGYRPPRATDQTFGSSVTRNPNTAAERRRLRLTTPKLTFKIRKGKKDITQSLIPKPKSRQKRFNDPEENFGKKSFVYTTRGLREAWRSQENEEKRPRNPREHATPRTSGRGPSERTSRREAPSASYTRSAWKSPEDEERRPRSTREHATPRTSGELPLGRTTRREAPTASYTRSARRAGGHTDRRTNVTRENDRDRDARTSRFRDDPPVPRRQQTVRRETSPVSVAVRKNPASEPPLSIPHTTAASQFLYGRSFVEAALQTSARKLYKLYIYRGANRTRPEGDVIIEQLARRRGVQVQHLEEGDLRLLDKMSEGRPHNGFVLEASPLPRLPVTGLGPLVEMEGDKGYRLDVGHQSAEDAAINGTSGLIRSSSDTHKPLVVVLDQILDPGNLGAILRTIHFLGADAVAMTKRGSADLTSVALKAASGASEAIRVFSIDNMSTFLLNSKENGWKICAAVPPTSRSRAESQLDMYELEDLDPLATDPCILLIGNEGEGLSKQLRSKADIEVSIPNMSGSAILDSLNVSVATGMLCSAMLRGKAKTKFTKKKEEERAFALF